MTSSSSAAARPASGSFATPPCAATARSCSSGSTSARAPRGRFHGLLHSGGRYVVRDPHSATECAEENAIVSRIAFRRRRAHRRPLRHDARATTPRTPTASWPAAPRPGCRSQEIDPGRGAGPRAAPQPRHLARLRGARTPRSTSGSCSGATPHSAREYGATDPHLPLGDRDPARRRPGRRARSRATTAPARRSASRPASWSTRAASGPARSPTWPDCPGVTVVPGKGIMIAMNHRLVSTVVNRCEPARRRRHPGADPHRLRHRHHRLQGRQPRRPPDPARRGAGDARRGRGARAGLPADAGAPRLGRARARCSRTSGQGRRRHPPHEPRPGADRPPRARRRDRLPHHHRRQAHHLPPDGRDGGRRHVRAARRGARPCRTAGEPLPGSEDGAHLLAGLDGWPRARRTWRDDQVVCECELVPRRGWSRPPSAGRA